MTTATATIFDLLPFTPTTEQAQFLFEIDESWHLTDPITLLDFESDFKRYPTLATELSHESVLQINIGKFADKRLEGNDQDIAEHVVITQDGAGKVKVYAPNLDVSAAQAQSYSWTSSL